MDNLLRYISVYQVYANGYNASYGFIIERTSSTEMYCLHGNKEYVLLEYMQMKLEYLEI